MSLDKTYAFKRMFILWLQEHESDQCMKSITFGVLMTR